MIYPSRAKTGLGGWLAILIVLLCMNAVGRLFSLIYPPLRPDSANTTEIIAAAIVSTSLVAILIFRREPSTLPLVISGLWLMALVGPATVGLRMLYVQGWELTAFAAATRAAVDWDFLPALVHAGIWTTYLARSTRVAKIYASPRHDLADVFG